MSSTLANETICAVATAPGRGGIGIVRVSGPLAPEVARKLTGTLPAPRYASFARFKAADGNVLDEGIALYFKAPDSFTGEDVLELQGHGGPVVLDMLLAAVIANGARVARPGEFSERAFLNGKLDLSQAEAVADLISATTEAAARSATRSLQGVLSTQVEVLARQLVELRAYIEAAIDFPDEELDLLNDTQLATRISSAKEALATLTRQAGRGVLLTEGCTVVLAGAPNAGKSSLLNHLSGTDSALITPVPGTTRDIIKESINIDGMPLQLLDTAGIRATDDLVESLGRERALAATTQADLVLLIVDSQNPDAVPEALSDLEGPVLRINNKIDLTDMPAGQISERMINVSAKTGAGIDALREAIKAAVGFVSESSAFSARRRHIAALELTAEHLNAAESCIHELLALELAAEELRVAHHHLQTITGVFTTEDLLGEIFSTFCIGK